MTAPDPVVVEVLREHLERQPWYQRFSNTVTSAIGMLSLVLWLAISAGVDIPEEWTRWVTAVIALLTTLGVYRRKNGLTPRGIEDTARYLGEAAETYGRHSGQFQTGPETFDGDSSQQ